MSLTDEKTDLESRIRTSDLEILNLSPKLFEPHRILLLKSLLIAGPVDFRQLKFGFDLSDGNLFRHLRALQQEGYITPKKEIVDEKLRTTYELTAKGRTEFERFLATLGSIARFEESR